MCFQATTTPKAEGVKSKEAPEKASAAEFQRPEKFADYSVACLWGREPFDKTLATIRAQLLERLGLKAESEVGSDNSKVVRLGYPELKVICLSSLAIGHTSAQIRYSIRRMRNRFSQAKVVLSSCGQDLHEFRSPEQATNGDADCYAASFRGAIECFRSEDLFSEPQDRQDDIAAAFNKVMGPVTTDPKVVVLRR